MSDISQKDLDTSTSEKARFVYPLVSIGALFLLWWAIVEIFHIPAYVLPTPQATFASIIEDWPELWSGFIVTGQVFLYGFVIGSVSGFVLAVLMANSKLLNRLLYPIMIISQAIPVIAIGAALVIWLGFGIAPKLVIVALVVFFPVLVNVLDGLNTVDKDMLDLTKSMGANWFMTFRQVQLPATYVPLFSALKMSATFSVTGAVLAEQTASSQGGLGQYMMAQASRLNTQGTFAAIILFAAMGLAAFLVVSLWEKAATPWRSKPVVPKRRRFTAPQTPSHQ
ncbi:MAG: ABC transporter permease [Bifidobacterium tibiigranuli]|jgi:ABC-type nitrate/sulfonate/bicarbonate transport system permease component|uniref:ABC transporter permease n=1 Tax=Bifidobacterium tibiigranuli TaxID=2172043 RepID=UPI0026EA8D58|nr:ABC transporter permease [Bifidobacterium tibiigranuli]MCI1674165.1 ABC transporter permease [Bifidobacterium tibiigranuli]MCI1712474.1 ABC transporter permease [Bifidobacterium tibiigranuli]